MIFIILFLFTIFSGEAQTSLSFQGLPKTVSGTYTLNQETLLPQTLRVRYRNKEAGSDYIVTFSAGQSGDFLNRLAVDGFGNTTGYQIYGDPALRNILKDLSAPPASSEVLFGYFPAANGNQTQTHSFTVAVSGLYFPAAGVYTDTVVMELYAGTFENPGIRAATDSFSLTITVPQILAMSLVPEGNPFDEFSTALDLNFGILSLGAQRYADLMVRGNVPYQISIMSQNGGVLRPADPADSSTVPYAFTINGNAAALPSGVSTIVVSGAARTTLSGSRYSLSFTIGDFGMATEGDYSDILTFTIAVN
jgi:hypothetical protein